MTEKQAVRDPQKEMVGWLTMALVMLAFPAVFFLCVFLPIWLGWAGPY